MHKGTFEVIQEPFIVATPRPYVVDLSRHIDGQARSATMERLCSDVQVLREVMAALGIGEWEARQEGYTLNVHTHQKLYRRASAAGRYDVCEKMNGAWSW
jgi:hypothetical protein